MRVLFHLTSVLAALSFTVTASAQGTSPAQAAKQALHAAAIAQDITPLHFPISVNGGMSDHYAQRAHDPLHARCLVLANEETALAIVVIDSCVVPRDLMDDAKRLTAAATGIPASHILISATHCHSAPTVTAAFQSEPDEAYRQFVIKQIAAGLTHCWNHLEPAQVAWGQIQVPGQTFIRRWLLKEGELGTNPFGQQVDRIRMNPGYQNPSVVRQNAVPDEQLSVFSVQSRDGRPIALLGNFSLHYVGGVEGDAVSADYFGEFANRIARHLKATQVTPAFVGIMSNGTSGDANNIDYSGPAGIRRQPYEQMGLVAETVAQAAAKSIENLTYQSHLPLAVMTEELTLGVRKPSAEELAAAQALLDQSPKGKQLAGLPAIYARESVLINDYPDQVKVLIQALRIGNLGIVSSPCETFAATGLAIKKESPFPTTFTIELANGYSGYLPTPEEHALGGYETWRARSSYLAVDAEPQIRATQLKLLKQIATISNPGK